MKTPDVPKERQCTMPRCIEPKAEHKGRAGLCGWHKNGDTPPSMLEREPDRLTADADPRLSIEPGSAADTATVSADGGTVTTELPTAEPEPDPDPDPDPDGDTDEAPDEHRTDTAPTPTGGESEQGSDEADAGPPSPDRPEKVGTWLINTAMEAGELSISGDRELPDGWTFDDRVPGIDGAIPKRNPMQNGPDFLCIHCSACYTDGERAADHVNSCTGIKPHAIGKKGRHQSKRLWMNRLGFRVPKHRSGTATAGDSGRDAKIDVHGDYTHRPPRAVKAEMAETMSDLNTVRDEELAREGGPRKEVIAVVNQTRARLKEKQQEMGLDADSKTDSDTDKRDLTRPTARSANGKGGSES